MGCGLAAPNRLTEDAEATFASAFRVKPSSQKTLCRKLRCRSHLLSFAREFRLEVHRQITGTETANALCLSRRVLLGRHCVLS